MAAEHPLRNAALLLATAGFASLASCASGPPKNEAAATVAAASAPVTACNFGAFVAESDPAGLNVRAAPSLSAKVLGKLPRTFVEPSAGYGVRIEVEVAGARNGWFLIRNAQDNDALTGQPPRRLYSGEGWVSGSKLTVKSQADVGRAQPGPQSAAVLRIGDNQTFDDDDTIEAARLVDCKGTWAQLEFADQRFPADMRATLKVERAAREGLPAGRFRAWVDRVCAIQETSCPSLGAPEPAP
ncbi:SH3 domain-containing protein [Roseateles chitinivorans]|uniref:SH3 domain-containing protein n=1 Tax=Roseateles chitinivorans TaxID=2917965 RepID=UPI003D6797F9